MQFPYSSREQIELTPSKLNFYLGQCNKNLNKSRVQSNTPLSTSRAHYQQKNGVYPSEEYETLRVNTPNKAITLRQSCYEDISPVKQYNAITNNESRISYNGPNHVISNLPLYHSDSLDEALIQSRNYSNILHESRKQSNLNVNCNSLDRQCYRLGNSAVSNPVYESGKYCQSTSLQPIYNTKSLKKNYSQIIYPRFQKQLQSYSPSSIPTQNFNYFNHHDNNSGIRKKVNWRVKPKKMHKKNVYYLKALEGYNQLSNQLVDITKQLKDNSKRLQSLNSVYDAIMKANQPPQTRKTLKRVNFKYGDVDEYYPKQQQIFRGRPRVYYEDKIYNDPKYIIWHPLYYRNGCRYVK